MGIGANGNDLAAKFLKPAEKLFCRQEITAPVHAAGIDLHALSLPHQNL